MSEKEETKISPPPEAVLKMRVKKRDGSLEYVNPDKIIQRVVRAAANLHSIEPMKVAVKTIGGLYDGVTTVELDKLAIHNAALLISEEPEYSKLAARLLSVVIAEEVATQGIHSFSQAMIVGRNQGLISEQTAAFVAKYADELDEAINDEYTNLFEYFGLATLYDRYLLKHPTSRKVIETPQYFFMRVAVGLAENLKEAIDFYNLMASFDFLPSTPTLFNSGTTHPQMSSCFLVDSPQDSLESIYQRYWQVAALSKWAGGIGIAYHRIRSRGSLIRGTNGFSSGIVPWLKTLDSSVAAVNQGGKRKGACCVYLETWHADIEDFLELRDTTGDQQRRVRHINIANWVPDLFMKRVKEDGLWSLFDPKIVPHLPDLYGEEFEKAYLEAEEKKLFQKQLKARDLYARMMKTLAETGNGWMTFKDACNKKSNQTGKPGNIIHSSNLCTEIVEVNSDKEIAVCNLGSINLANHLTKDSFDFKKLARTVQKAVTFLDRVIDRNLYPLEEAKNSNLRWRPIGLGVMGLQDVFFKLRLPFDSPAARELSTKIQEEIYYYALESSCQLASKLGPCPAFKETRTAEGVLSFDLWGVKPSQAERFEELRKKIKKNGLRNSLLVAIAPTATIASIAGVYESIEPQIANILKRETMSGEYIQINRYLISDLKKLGLWSAKIREAIIIGEGSIQHIEEIPAELKVLYRTCWELSMKPIIEMAAARAPFIDQSQSLNLFVENPSISSLASMYMYAWEKGLKTTYYLRSRPATTIAKISTPERFGMFKLDKSTPIVREIPKSDQREISVQASSSENKENPPICEACQ